MDTNDTNDNSKMLLFPVRCTNCGKPLSNYQHEFEESSDWGKTLDELNIKRMCCRMNILGMVPTNTGYGFREPKDFEQIQYLTSGTNFKQTMSLPALQYGNAGPSNIPLSGVSSIPSLGPSFTNKMEIMTNFEDLSLKEKLKQSINTNEEDTILLVKEEFERTNYGYIEPLSKKYYLVI